ncbi:MAG TPA: hypothetical protein VLZ50_00935 [Terracidiphilus sp.]|nr:hypothetical protein [Terracidiphilus sp.]
MSVIRSFTRRTGRETSRPVSRRIEPRLACAAAIPLLLAALPCLAQNGANPCKSIHDPVLTTPPDANAQMEMRQQQQTKPADFAAANLERKKQISDDSAKLVKLATELKTEVDKTTKDTLSLDVIRKADEIERLARSVKEKMKLEAGGS